MARRSPSAVVDRPLTHQISLRRSGIGRRRAENENDPASSAEPRLWKATATATRTKSRKSMRPPWLMNTN